MGCVAYKLNINHRQSSIIAGENIQKFGLTRRVISLYPATYRAFYVRICTKVRRTGDAQRLEMFQDIIPSMETPRYRARYLLRLSSEASFFKVAKMTFCHNTFDSPIK